MSQIKQYRIKRQVAKMIATGTLAVICQPTWGAGFQILEQNVTNLGTAYAGTASLAADASTGYYNPAGLTRLCKEQVAGSLIWIQGHPKLHVTEANNTIGAQISPGATRPSAYALIPALHYATPISENWTYGFNITSPFGLRNNYATDSIARYTATRSELRTTNLSPSVAIKLSDCFSLGVGIDAQHSHAKLNQVLYTPPANSSRDYSLESTGKGWGVGFHVGLMWDLNEETRIGVNYRSKIKTHLKGNVIATSNNVLLDNTKINSTLNYPETVTLSGFHELTDCCAVMADVQWTHWKRFETLAINAPAIGYSLITPENFKDSYRVALGTTYKIDNATTLRFGVAHDKTPVRDQFRTIRIPDNDRTWAAIGAQYRLSECVALELGYAHLFVKRAKINEVAPRSSIPLRQMMNTLKGSNSMSADIIGIQLTWDIG